jgi:hypothetical protein
MFFNPSFGIRAHGAAPVHLPRFTLEALAPLPDSAGLRLEIVRRYLRILDAPGGRINRFSRLFGVWPLHAFCAYQYVLRQALPDFELILTR